MREYTIGEVSRLTQVKVETIRYYEKIGIMPNPPRSSGGYRMYSTTHLERLSFVRRSRELGFSQPEVRRLLKLVDEHNYTCGEVQSLTLHQLENVRAKIADLRKLEKTLAAMAAECEGGTIPECPVIEALFETNKQRPS